MLSLRQQLIAAMVVLAIAGVGAGAASAQDREAVIKNREALMKGQGKDLGSIKAYIDGKGELAQAEAGAAGLTQSTKKIPEVFPPGTGGADTEGKFAAQSHLHAQSRLEASHLEALPPILQPQRCQPASEGRAPPLAQGHDIETEDHHRFHRARRGTARPGAFPAAPLSRLARRNGTR